MKGTSTRKEIKNFGVINLNELDFVEDTLEVFIPIESVSAELQKRINAEAEKAKDEYLEDARKWNPERFENGWSKTGINVNYFSLQIVIKKKVFSYFVNYEFSDKEDEFLDAYVKLEVDLSEHEQELKKIIIKAMIDNFF